MNDIVFAGARLITAGGATELLTEVHVADGRIAAIGSVDAPRARRIDLDGRFLIPGMWDQHVHFGQWAAVSRRLDLSRTRSAAEAAALVRERVAGDENDWNRSRLLVGAQDPAQVEAVHPRQPGLGDDDARMTRQRFRERFASVLGFVDFAHVTHDLAGGMGVTTPREQVELLTRLARAEILSPELCAHLRGVLERQHFQDQLPRWLGWNPYAPYHGRDQMLHVGSKSGELDGIRADVGLVRHADKGTLALAVFTDGGRDVRETVDVEGALAVAECSAAICARMLGIDA